MATVSPNNTVFTYKGMDRKGKKVTGEISSASIPSAKAQLIKQGIRATSVKKRPKPRADGKSIKPFGCSCTRLLVGTIGHGQKFDESDFSDSHGRGSQFFSRC